MGIQRNVRVMVAVIVFLSSAFCFTRQVFALDLFNDDALLAKLRKNQVVSDRDIAEIKSSYPKLELMGTLQLQYANNGVESSTSESVSDLSMKRMNLRVAAHLSDKTSIFIEPEYGKGEAAVKDAYLVYKPAWFELFAGNHRIPFGADALKNDINLPFAERNLASGIAPDYLPGVSLVRTLFGSRLILQAGIWNGTINSKAETGLINNSLADNRIFSVNNSTAGSNILIEAVRVAYSSKPHDNFYAGGRSFDDDENFNGGISYGVGLSYFNSAAVHDKAPANGLTGLNGANAYEADLFFRIWRISTEFEYAKRNLDWWQYSFAQTSNESAASAQTAFSARASVMVIGNLSMNLRYETFTYDDKENVLTGIYGQSKDKWLTAGLTYYFKEQHTKVQANYVWKSEDMPSGGTSPENNTMYLQATMFF